ncbi:MAG TPA: LLM class flavin-dependent oxidoreductase [Candidatus Binatia bacterium]|nr:LLM class flavin-dependent oxidoreductase [Candidatus Binatia bacterium]
MEFGIFSQMHVPLDETEHSRFMRSVDVSLASDAAGFKYDWSPEHHFLFEYSHQPAPEVYMSFVAARTKRIHLGHAIVNLCAVVNHPARVAERAATLDHLSEGRLELGTGRGSSSTEWGGFAIPSAPETKAMWQEAIEQIPRMWRDEPYEFEGKYFRMPKRTVLPKPYSKPHPPLWVACSSPPTFTQAGEMGLGALCFTTGTAEEVAGHIRNYKEGIKRCKKPVGEFVNDHVMVTGSMYCLEDGDEARRIYCQSRPEHYIELLLTWLDSIPRAPYLPQTGPVKLQPYTAQMLKERMKIGGQMIGDPDEVSAAIKLYESIGADSLVFAPLVVKMDQKNVLRSVETFGKHVIPRFDKDPIHSTTRAREAALAKTASGYRLPASGKEAVA